MKLCGVNISAITKKEAIDRVENALKTGKQEIIFTPNPEILLEAKKNNLFLEALSKGTLMLPDGHGLLFVSTLMLFKSKFVRAILFLPAFVLFLFYKKPFKKIIPHVIHGSDFMYSLVKLAVKNKKSVFFLGGSGFVAKATASFFKQKFPDLKIAGFSSFDPGKDAVFAVNKSKADVLFVAYGAPKQEIFVAEFLPSFCEQNIIMTVGGSFDFYSGNIKRAPKFLRSLGLEWFWRFLNNPLARIKRIFNAVFRFPIEFLF